MTITSYTVLNSAAWSGLLVLLLFISVRSPRLLKRFGRKPPQLLAFVCGLKLLLLVEPEPARELPASVLLNPVNEFLKLPAGHAGNMERLLLLLWLLGSGLLLAGRLGLSLYRRRVLARLPNSTDPRIEAFRRRMGAPGLRVAVTDRVETPCAAGLWRESILLPELDSSTKRLNLILLHEFSHVRHHDGMKDCFTGLLCILYWWNPFVYLYRAAVRNLCDYRSDLEALGKSSPSEGRFYCRSILFYAHRKVSGPGRCFAANSLSNRFHLILEEKRECGRAFLLVLSLLLAAAVLFSYLVVFQPSYQPTAHDYNGKPVQEEPDGSVVVSGIAYR